MSFHRNWPLWLASSLLWAHAAVAQPYPSRPIALVSPFPAGGGVDLVARMIGQKLSEALGQPVVVENRTGASGNLGAAYVARAPADGYTLMLTNNSLLVNPAASKAPFDVLKDFTPVALIGSSAIAVGVHPSLKVDSGVSSFSVQ